MIFRIFLAILALVAAYLLFDIGRISHLTYKIHTPQDGYFTGSRSAPITVVEFLDYSCPKCVNTHPSLTEAKGIYPNIYYVPRPILSQTESGTLAGQFVYAAGLQGKFIEAHETVIQNGSSFGEADIQRFSEQLGLDYDQIQKDLNNDAVVGELEKNKDFILALKSPTIPTFLINGKFIWFVDNSYTPNAGDFLKLFEEASR